MPEYVLTCQRCDGIAWIVDDDGNLQQCPDCGGEGTITTSFIKFDNGGPQQKTCPHCGGIID